MKKPFAIAFAVVLAGTVVWLANHRVDDERHAANRGSSQTDRPGDDSTHSVSRSVSAASAIYGIGDTRSGDGVFPRDPYLSLVYANAVAPYLDAQRQSALSYRIDAAEAKLPPDRVLQARADGVALSAKMAAAGATVAQWPPESDGGWRNAAVDCDH